MLSKRSLVSTFLALPLLAVALLPLAAQGVVHRVHVGGPDACESMFGERPGCNANFSLVALELRSGRVVGQFTDQFGGGEGIHAVVDCVSVVGNEAWLSGWITQGTLNGVDLAGEPVATRVRDNGTSWNDPPDEISFSWIGDDRPCTDQVDYDLFEMPRGQVVVR